MKYIHAIVKILLISLLVSHVWAADDATVNSRGNKYIGDIETDKNVATFKGIPYAHPPVGDLRWAPPKPLRTRGREVQALRYGNSCLQMLGVIPVVTGHEDCLNLNIWKPLKPGKKKKPVMVFIHGGANVIGSSNQSILGENLYDGANLADNGDVIVVTINYRLGPMGFLASTALSENSETGTSGNYGLMDQIEALKWVRDNIAAFGGDRENVTIFGESAGAANVIALMASPQAEGLFHKAIAQSGVIYDTPLEDAEKQGDEFLKSLGCDPEDIDCARQISPKDIIRAMPLKRDGSKPIGHVIDDHVLHDDVVKVFKDGRHNHVPFMIGTNEDEFALLLPMFLEDSYYISERRFRQLVVSELGEKAYPKIAKEYNKQKYGSYRKALMALLADKHFHLPAHLITDALEGSQDPKVWQYVFDHNSNLGWMTGLGATHAMELPLLFGAYKGTWGRADHLVSDYIMRLWTNFAHTGDPIANDSDLPHWPESTEGALYISDELRVRDHIRHNECMRLLKTAEKAKAD